MAKGDDFQFRVRPPPEPAAQQRTDRRHGAVESRENRDWRDCADRLDKSEIRRISSQGELVRTAFIGSRIRFEGFGAGAIRRTR
jgi:hypothetical protein